MLRELQTQTSSAACKDGVPPPGEMQRNLPPGRPGLEVRQVIERAVTMVFGVGPDAIGGATRGPAQIALARQTAMYLMHVVCCRSLTETGRLFGRDRTTVAHACEVIEDKRDDPAFNHALDLLEWCVPVMATRPAVYLRHLENT